ncbi:SDR family oxidoreductase [Streptomyces litmocidini]|uniref:SDR family NAD(P)-dependent oxidoreductase n=1 Tax=Streptomyces TaxID=1883 RepID=UPI000F48F00C|nr:SDR family oxidoreductase [Streptomyces sp. PanSC19]ROQ36006.1 short-subunit dehydrogenase [Streptomyces sp. PanSC19]
MTDGTTAGSTDGPTGGGRVLVVGATGAVGGLAAGMLADRGASVALAGRDRARLQERSGRLGGCPARSFDAYDLDACTDLAPWAARSLGGLDAVVVAVGVAGFGPAEDVPDTAAEHLMTVNALAPMAVVRGALRVLGAASVLAVVTGAVVDRPVRGTADYTAAKSALAAWLGVVRREQRGRGISVVDVRLPPLDTGFAGRAVIGRPPVLPPGLDAATEVDRHLVTPVLTHEEPK